MLVIRGAMPFGLTPALFEKLYENTILEADTQPRNVGLQFVSSTKMASLTAAYAQSNRATDVLSFESDQPDSFGDVVICSRIAQSQAVAHKVRVDSELGLLFVHGLLHLLGYDHQTTEGVIDMRRLQTKILTQTDLEAPTYP